MFLLLLHDYVSFAIMFNEQKFSAIKYSQLIIFPDHGSHFGISTSSCRVDTEIINRSDGALIMTGITTTTAAGGATAKITM
jgi:hypothetical protein